MFWSRSVNDSAVVGDYGLEVTNNYSYSQPPTTSMANPTMPSPGRTHLDHIRISLHYIALPIIVFFGAIGNLFAFCVLVRRRMRTRSVYFYMAVLACADTVLLLVGPFRNWIRVLTDFDLIHTSNFTCKFIIFLIVFSQHLSAWLIVLLTVDRFLSIWHPFFAASFCIIARARVITLLLVCILIVYNIHIFWTFELLTRNNTQQMCTIDKHNPFHYIYDYLKAITYCLFPSTIVLILNSCIIYKVMQRKKDVEGSTHCNIPQPMESHRVTRRKNHVTTMLLVISFVWLALTTPYGIFSVSRTQMSEVMDPSVLRFSVTICFLLFYLNHSVNFYLYCLTGQKIRKEFVELFLCIFRCSKVHRRRKSVNKTIKTQRTPLANEAEVRLFSANVQLRRLSARLELLRNEAPVQTIKGKVKMSSI